jgi:hypothetical protein
MRGVQLLGAVVALVVSVLLLRIVVHLYADHGHVDVFHLFIAMAAACAGVLLIRRALLTRS